jgi:hypothetical protein
MANTQGGVIVLGIKADDGAAALLTPVPLSEEEELRVRSVVASNVAPLPQLELRRIEGAAATQGVYLRRGFARRWRLRDRASSRDRVESNDSTRFKAHSLT